MLAIYLAFQLLENNQILNIAPAPFSTVDIFTDSRSSVQCLIDRFNKNPIASHIRALHGKIGNHLKIRIRWIKAHAGNERNEHVDLLAKLATKHGIKSYNLIPISAFKRILNQQTAAKYYANYQVKSREFLSDAFFDPPEMVKNLHDFNASAGVMQFLSGKRNWSAHLAGINRKSSADCASCGEADQGHSIHVLYD